MKTKTILKVMCMLVKYIYYPSFGSEIPAGTDNPGDGKRGKNYTYSFLCVRYRQVYYSSFVSEEILTGTEIPGGGGIKTEAILKVMCVIAKCVYYPCFGSKEIPGGDRGRRRRGERETILYKFCVCLSNNYAYYPYFFVYT